MARTSACHLSAFPLSVVSLFLVSASLAPLVAQELDGNEDFALIGSRGLQEVVNGNWPVLVPNALGSARNSYPWSLAEFNGKVYLGLIRDVFCFLTDPSLRPDDCPPADEGEFPTPTADQAAEIWEYTPSVDDGGINGTWQRVHVSPFLGFPINLVLPDTPRDIGYRGMEVCDADDPGQEMDRLYVATVGIPGLILVSEDGASFDPASTLGLNADVGLLSLLNLDFDLGYRPIECFRDRLWTTPVATLEDTDLSNNPVVLANPDPADAGSAWIETSLPGFGDPDNLSVFDLGTFDADDDGEDDYLYAGTFNRTTGAEIWRTNGLIDDGGNGGDCSPTTGLCTWEQVLDAGGGRVIPAGEEPDNAGATAFTDLDGYLYVGLADAASNSPTLAEMVRFRGTDGMFELVMGEPRDPGVAVFNWDSTVCGAMPAGLCSPISLRGPGFGPEVALGFAPGGAVYLWRMSTFLDEVYAGTLQFGPVFGPEFNPPGFDLLKSSDGVSWDFVSMDGLGDTSNGGLRTFLPTDEALYVGGTNSREGFVVFSGTTVPERPPTADPGPDLLLFDDASTGAAGDGMVAFDLDGSDSFDPFGGEIVAWEWYTGDLTGSCLIGSEIPINAGTTDNPVFAQVLDASSDDDVLNDPFESYLYTLRVEDDFANEDCALLSVVASANLLPSALITSPVGSVLDPMGGPRILYLADFDGDGEEVVPIEGLCTDPEGDLASCVWTIGDGATLSPPAPELDTMATVVDAATAETLYGDPSPNLLLTAADNVPWEVEDEIQIYVSPFVDGTGNDAPVCRSGWIAALRSVPFVFDPADSSNPRTYLCDDPDADVLAYTTGGTSLGLTLDGADVTYDTVVSTFDGPDFFTLFAEDPSTATSATVRVTVRICDVSLSDIDLVVESETLTGSSDTRTACISVTGRTSTIQGGADVSFIAGDAVVLDNGFLVESGALFTAEIDSSLVTP